MAEEKGISPIDVQKALHGASYPAKKKDLAELARNNGAGDVASSIEKSGTDRFDGPNDVQKAVFRGK
ncbi:hypothetical protein GCM10027168_06880 [Streptomyces capparidis]